MNLQNLQAQCKATVEAAYKAAEAHYGKTIKRVPVVFSNQLTSTAGHAEYQYNTALGTITSTQIKLSNKLLELNGTTFVEQTPGHEAAHLIAMELFGAGASGHGRKWQEVMHVIGQEAQRCHNMATPKTNKIETVCGCSTHYITKIRANRIHKGAKYKCNKCKQHIKIVTAPTITAQPKASKKTNTKSNAAMVREYINNNYNTVAQATTAQDTIIDWASTMFKSRGAARSCVLANIPKAF